MSVTTNNFAFMIDGRLDGAYVRKVDPGRRKREKKEHKAGSSMLTEQQAVGKLTYDPIKFDVSLAMGEGMLSWIQEFFRGSPVPHSGSFLVGKPEGGDLVAAYSIEFKHALIQDVTIPELNAEPGETPYLSVTIQPAFTETKKINTTIAHAAETGDPGVWDSSNFTCDVSGMTGNQSGQLVKVESFTLAAEVKADKTCGEDVPLWKCLGFKTMPDLKLHYHDELHDFFLDWEREFLQNSMNSKDQHRTVTLEWKQRGTDKTLATITCMQAGIIASPHAAFDATSMDFMRNSVDVYFSNMSIAVG